VAPPFDFSPSLPYVFSPLFAFSILPSAFAAIPPSRGVTSVLVLVWNPPPLLEGAEGAGGGAGGRAPTDPTPLMCVLIGLCGCSPSSGEAPRYPSPVRIPA